MAAHVPPPYVAPAPVGVTLGEVQVESQGRVYHIRLGMPCGVDGRPLIRKLVRVPSNTETIFVDCDGSMGFDILQDPETGATAPKKK